MHPQQRRPAPMLTRLLTAICDAAAFVRGLAVVIAALVVLPVFLLCLGVAVVPLLAGFLAACVGLAIARRAA